MKIESSRLATVLRGEPTGPSLTLTGVSIDSRSVEAGDLFVALEGPHNDGHDFLAEALENAAGALVSSSAALDSSTARPDRALIRVPDTLVALQAFSRHVLQTLRPRVVAITGSVGKTTTKEMAAGLLAARYRAVRSAGNLNNAIGLPLEVARLPEGVEVAVLELGMSTPGEIRFLSKLVEPDVGVVTAVAPAHLMNFPSLDAVMEAKAEILEGMTARGVFVANADDERSLSIGRRHAGPVLTYGLGEEGRGRDVFALSLRAENGGTRFLLRVKGEEIPVLLPLPGRHNVSNFLAAAAVATALGMSPAEIAARASFLAAASHRGEVRLVEGGVLLYDDSYNSSPAALAAAFEAFESVAKDRRRVAVIGEMRELGPLGPELHRAAGRELAGRCDVLVAVKGEAASIVSGARERGAGSVLFAESAEEALPLVRSLLLAGDALFVKGSHSVELERLVRGIEAPGLVNDRLREGSR